MMFLFADCVPFPHFVQTHGLVQGNFACFRPYKTGPSALVIHRLFFFKPPRG